MNPCIVVYNITQETNDYKLLVIQGAEIVYKEECGINDLFVVTETRELENGVKEIIDGYNDFSKTPILEIIHNRGIEEFGNYWEAALHGSDIILNAVTAIHPEFDVINVVEM